MLAALCKLLVDIKSTVHLFILCNCTLCINKCFFVIFVLCDLSSITTAASGGTGENLMGVYRGNFLEVCVLKTACGRRHGLGLWVTGTWLADFAVADCACSSTNLDILQAPNASVRWSSSCSVPEGLKYLIVCVERHSIRCIMWMQKI